jgi:hypothetical protein
VRKLCGNDTSDWDDKVILAQLCANIKYRHRTGSTPFSLMYARQMNRPKDYTDKDNESEIPKIPAPIEELEKRAELMSEVVFPAIKERTQKILEEYDQKYNNKHYIIDIPIGTAVMVRLPHRTSKLSVLYEGPYIVHRKTKANNYVLKTETNELLHRDYTPSELKIVTIDETAIEDELYVVEEVRDHRNCANGEREYLVKWEGYGERENSWIPASLFSTPEPISKYWNKVRELEQLEQERKSRLVKASKGKEKEIPILKTRSNKTSNANNAAGRNGQRVEKSTSGTDGKKRKSINNEQTTGESSISSRRSKRRRN